jgi:hypothetical protein
MRLLEMSFYGLYAESSILCKNEWRDNGGGDDG